MARFQKINASRNQLKSTSTCACFVVIEVEFDKQGRINCHKYYDYKNRKCNCFRSWGHNLRIMDIEKWQAYEDETAKIRRYYGWFRRTRILIASYELKGT